MLMLTDKPAVTPSAVIPIRALVLMGRSCINTNDTGMGNAWGCHVVLTIGYVLVASMAIPCGYYNLDDNMVIQVAPNPEHPNPNPNPDPN